MSTELEEFLTDISEDINRRTETERRSYRRKQKFLKDRKRKKKIDLIERQVEPYKRDYGKIEIFYEDG